jgi:hypothetical protein
LGGGPRKLAIECIEPSKRFRFARLGVRKAVLDEPLPAVEEEPEFREVLGLGESERRTLDE